MLYLAKPSTNIDPSTPVEKRFWCEILTNRQTDGWMLTNVFSRESVDGRTDGRTDATKRIIFPASRSIMINTISMKSEIDMKNKIECYFFRYFENPFTIYHWLGTAWVFSGTFLLTDRPKILYRAWIRPRHIEKKSILFLLLL